MKTCGISGGHRAKRNGRPSGGGYDFVGKLSKGQYSADADAGYALLMLVNLVLMSGRKLLSRSRVSKRESCLSKVSQLALSADAVFVEPETRNLSFRRTLRADQR